MSKTLGAFTDAGRKPAAIAVGVFLLLWLPAVILTHGFPEADGASHYVLARFAINIPAIFTDVWGRPLCTAIYALPAFLGGRLGANAAATLIAIGCAIVSQQIAREQGDRLPVLALIFTLAQPWLFIHSLSPMTELPFALVLGAAFLAFIKKRWFAAALLSSLLPLARPEGFGFLLIAACALAWLAPRRWLLILPLPLVLWSFAGWGLNGREGHWWQWLIHNWPYSATSLYGHGSWLTFIVELPAIVSPLVLPATLLGIWRSCCRGENASSRAARIASALIPMFVLAVHTLIYVTGKMGSYGEARYLLVASPFWGVLSGRGWEWCFRRLRLRHPLLWAGAAALVPAVINIFHPYVPVQPPPDWVVAQKFVQWYENSPDKQQYPRLICSHMAIYYYADISPWDRVHSGSFDRATIWSLPKHTLLVWDQIYGPRNASADRAIDADEIVKAGWEEDTNAEMQLRLGRNWRIFHPPS